VGQLISNEVRYTIDTQFTDARVSVRFSKWAMSQKKIVPAQQADMRQTNDYNAMN
jgi:hypothetical protein